MSRTNRFLVVVRAGDQSLHPAWTRSLATRDWDLVVSYFGDDPQRFRGAGETRIDDKGLKCPGLYALLTRDDFWCRYDHIWFPDDDLEADQTAISTFFAQVAELKLSLAQPALSWASYFSHPVTVWHPSFRVRWTNFIEIMAPCFERSFLETCLATFAENQSGWGLGWVWPQLLGVETRRSAVIDTVTVTHTRPVGGPTIAKLKELGITAEDERNEVLRKYGLEADPPRKAIAAIDTRGGVLDLSLAEDSRVFEALRLRDWLAFRATRQPPASPAVVLEARFLHQTGSDAPPG